MRFRWQDTKKYLKTRSAEPKQNGQGLTLYFSLSGPVIWRRDRLSRSLKDLIEMVKVLGSNRLGLKSLQGSIDTTSSSGMLIFHLPGAVAAFERNLTRERTPVGLQAARSRGRKGAGKRY